MGVVHLLLNPTATGPRRASRIAALRDALTGRGHEVVELAPPSPGAVAATIAEARSDGLERLVVAGGDGLVHHALPALAHSGIPVGLVPVGTGNDFARALGLHTTDIDRAVDAALDEPVPTGLIAAGGERWAASIVTGGFSGAVNARANGLSFPPGQHRYTVATLLELAHLGPLALTLHLDDRTHHLDATLFAVGNTRYFGGGMAICPAADPDDDLLDVTVIGPTSKLTFARLLPTVFSGRHVEHPSVRTFRARRVAVEVEVGLWADGEPFVDGPFQSDSGALLVGGRLGERPQGCQ